MLFEIPKIIYKQQTTNNNNSKNDQPQHILKHFIRRQESAQYEESVDSEFTRMKNRSKIESIPGLLISVNDYCLSVTPNMHSYYPHRRNCS